LAMGVPVQGGGEGAEIEPAPATGVKLDLIPP